MIRPSASADETEQLGRQVAALAEPGDVLLLVGPLGAGKTTFVRGLAAGLGLDPGEVSSPTFVIQHIHEGPLPFYHFDLYRLSSPDELFDFGADDFFWGRGLCVIEWPDLARASLPPNRLEVHLRLHPSDPEQRQIELFPEGTWTERILKMG